MDRDPNRVQRPTIRRLNVPSSSRQSKEWEQTPPRELAQPQKNTEKRSGIDRDILLTGAGCVLILFAGLLIAGVFALRVIGNRTTPEQPTVPAVAAAPTATDTPEPTSTPTPTPESPYTPLPTWTPMGAKSQVYDYRGHDAQYRNDVLSLDDFMKKSIVDVNTLLQNPQTSDQNWQFKILTQTDVWQQYFSETQATIPPDQYQTFHENLTKAMSHLKTGADDITFALEFQEPNRFDQAKSEIATGSKMLDTTIASLRSTN